MKYYKELKREFSKVTKEYNKKMVKYHDELYELRKNCKHSKTHWIEVFWAVSHSTGKACRVCDICGEGLETSLISTKEAYDKGYLKKVYFMSE